MIRADLETPCLLLDRARLERNIRDMAEVARRYGLALRPHIKTHKSVKIARMQMEAGAAGITASKSEEALVFARAGFPSITVAYPILDPAKLERLFEAAREHGTDLRMVVDSEAGLEALIRAEARAPHGLSVFIEIDVGLGRCGLREGDPVIVKLAREIEKAPHLRFAGLLSHAGHAYAAANAAEIAAIAEEECAILGRVRGALERDGRFEVSVGATPTALVSSVYTGITELRPGNYALLDLTSVRKGLVEEERIALSVLATVVSANEEFHIVDAGSKTLSSDMGAHGLAGGAGYGIAYTLEEFPGEMESGLGPARSRGMAVARLSEEHGFLKREAGGPELKVGDRVRILPNHACPVANLAREYVVIDEDGGLERWPVDARGCVK